MQIAILEPKYLTKKELATCLRVSTKRIERMTAKGEAPQPNKEIANLNRYDYQECKAMLGIQTTISSD